MKKEPSILVYFFLILLFICLMHLSYVYCTFFHAWGKTRYPGHIRCLVSAFLSFFNSIRTTILLGWIWVFWLNIFSFVSAHRGGGELLGTFRGIFGSFEMWDGGLKGELSLGEVGLGIRDRD